MNLVTESVHAVLDRLPGSGVRAGLAECADRVEALAGQAAEEARLAHRSEPMLAELEARLATLCAAALWRRGTREGS